MPENDAKQGLDADRSPFAEEKAKGGPPEQEQEWPGSDRELRPKADHGEESYRGSGKLEGLTALVTGGDSGIGRAVAIAFAREGADVAISYYSEDEDAQETKRWVEKAGRDALLLPGDLASHGHCHEIVRRTVDSLGGLNILVNNAAVHVEQSDFLQISPAQVEETFRVNIMAYMWMAQAALPHLGEGDSILNTGSVTALDGHPSLIDYGATKAAIHNFTKSLAQVVAERGIRVNCVAPGPVWTPLIASTKPPESVAEHGASSLWERPAQPAEIAPSYVFLASADARYYTGEILAPTGLRKATR